MNTRAFRLLFTWNIVLTVLLLIALAFAAVSAQAANDPPVKVYSASLAHGNGVAGTGSDDKLINSTTFQDILTVPVNFTGQAHVHHCVLVASANVINPATGGDTGNFYEFGVGLDGSSASIYSFSTMKLELNDNDTIDDHSWMPVTTNRVFTSLSAAAHTIRFQARKTSAGAPNLTVDNAYATVICFKKLQTMLGAAEPEAPLSDNPVNDQ